jgi:hypothetical protein
MQRIDVARPTPQLGTELGTEAKRSHGSGYARMSDNVIGDANRFEHSEAYGSGYPARQAHRICTG